MRRRDDGIVPFTVMSCDNIPHNGHVTSDGVIGLARLIDEDLADWVSDNVAFPERHGRPHHAGHHRPRARHPGQANSASRTTGRCSASRSGNGCWRTISPTAGRRWKRSACSSSRTSRPIELMKIRILNGGHATIAYPAGLMDIHFVHEAMQEPLVRGFLAKLEHDEIIPTVPPVPDTVLEDYYQLIEQPLLQPEDRRHHPPALPRRLQPAAEIHHPDHRRPAEGRKGRRRPGAGIGAVVPLLLRHHRQRRGHRAQRPELGPAAGDGQGGEGRRRPPGLPWRTSMAMSAARRRSPRPSPMRSTCCGRTARARR